MYKGVNGIEFERECPCNCGNGDGEKAIVVNGPALRPFPPEDNIDRA
jgi:hypothetical protein